jgi:hypothetical protein
VNWREDQLLLILQQLQALNRNPLYIQDCHPRVMSRIPRHRAGLAETIFNDLNPP